MKHVHDKHKTKSNIKACMGRIASEPVLMSVRVNCQGLSTALLLLVAK